MCLCWLLAGWNGAYSDGERVGLFLMSRIVFFGYLLLCASSSLIIFLSNYIIFRPDLNHNKRQFLNYIFKQSLKISLPRTAAEIAKVGSAISRTELKPGDLVLFNTTGRANSHIGLYMGNDQFIHAPRTGRNIGIDSLNNSYWKKHYTGARRIKP